MKKLLFILLLTFSLNKISKAQSVTIDPKNTATSIIDAKTTNQGVSVPKMTTIQKNAIPNKTEGMLVYDTDLKQFSYWKEFTGMPGLGNWQNFGTPVNVDTYWNPSGNNINNGNIGNVGIGTGSPMQKLDVVGSIKLTGEIKPNGASGLVNQVLKSNGSGGMTWGAVSAAGWATADQVNFDNTFKLTYPDVTNRVVRVNSPVLGQGGYLGLFKNGGLSIYNSSNGVKQPYLTMDGQAIQARYQDDNAVNGYEDEYESDLILNPFGGNVGIGNNTPTKARLVVDSSPSVITNALFGSNGSGISLQKNWPGVGYNSYRDNANVQRYMANGWAMVTAVDQVNGTFFWNKMGYGLANTAVSTGEQYVAGINQTGDFHTIGSIGIGTLPNITYRLSVNGVIRAKEVIVETGWADYVFDENYQLRTIEEMESFIKENKHLPNIPAASEIESKGLKVGETNKVMMEKIEELALYIIQLKKEIDVLKSKN